MLRAVFFQWVSHRPHGECGLCSTPPTPECSIVALAATSPSKSSGQLNTLLRIGHHALAKGSQRWLSNSGTAVECAHRFGQCGSMHRNNAGTAYRWQQFKSLPP